MRRELIFLAKFFLIYGTLQAIIYFADISFLTDRIASFEADLLNLQSSGNKILFSKMTFVISNSCTGLVSISIFAAIVFSLKKPKLKQKLIMFVLCSILLFIINLFRIALVILTGLKLGTEFVEPMHVASWFLMSGAIIFLWYYSTKKIAKIKDFSSML